MAAKCVFCNGDIKEDRDYRKVSGYEKRRAHGGTNALRLRVASEEWACALCIDRQARGNNVNQGALI